MNRLRAILLGTKNRQDVIWNIGSFGIAGVLGLLINVIIAHFYEPDVLGIFNQVYSLYILFSQIAVGGTHLSVLKNVPQNINDTQLLKTILSAALILTIIISIPIAVIFALISHPASTFLDSPKVAIGMLYAAPGLVLASFGKVYMSFLNGLSKMKAFAVFQALRYILIFLVILFFCLLQLNSNAIPVAFTIAEAFLFLALIIYLRKWVTFSDTNSIKTWVKQHFSFGMKVVGGHVLLDINSRVDVLVLGYFCSDAVVGIYSFASILADGFYQLVMVLRNNVNPLLTKSYYERKEKLINLISQWKKKAYLLFIPIGACIIGLFPLAVFIVQNKTYYQGWLPFSILMMGIMIAVGYLPFQMILNQTGYPEYQTLFIFVIFATNLILNIILVPFYGINGSAIATALASGLQIVFLKLLAQKIIKVKI